MNRSRPAGWVLLAGLILYSVSTLRAQPAPPVATLPLDEIMAELARAPQRRAHFVEDKRLAALSTPLHSEGDLAYRKPDHLEKITTAPHYESLIIDGDSLTVKDSPDADGKVFDVRSRPEIGMLVATIRGAVSGDLPLLRRYYEISGTGQADSWSILLRPRSPATARLVKQVQLVGDAELRGIQSLFPNGDSDTLTITSLP